MAEKAEPIKLTWLIHIFQVSQQLMMFQIDAVITTSLQVAFLSIVE